MRKRKPVRIVPQRDSAGFQNDERGPCTALENLVQPVPHGTNAQPGER